MNKTNIAIRFLQRITKLPSFMVDGNVSWVNKLVIMLMFAYIISPLDLIPEPIIGLGILDDTILTFYIISSISDKLDVYIENDQRKNIKKPIESHDYRVMDEDDE